MSERCVWAIIVGCGGGAGAGGGKGAGGAPGGRGGNLSMTGGGGELCFM